MVQINDELAAKVSAYETNLNLMYSAQTLQLSHKLISGKLQYLGLGNLGANMENCKMHQQLLTAYGKVWKR